MRHPSKRTAQAGFTLLEVLIAMTLMAVLGILSWRALDSTTRSSERLEAHADDTMGLLRALGQVESDLNRHVGVTTLPTHPATATPLAAALPPGIDWNAPRLTILRTAHEGSWQEVVWTLADGTLVRAAGEPSQTLPLPAAHDAETMLTDVQGFEVRAWLPGLGWAEQAPTAAPLKAGGLEIVIVRRHDGTEDTYRKVVMLP